MFYYQSQGGDINLQATLAAASATSEPYFPHHPIACNTTLRYEEDGSLSCDHGTVPPDDGRTNACIIGSIATLLFEILHEQEVKKYADYVDQKE